MTGNPWMALLVLLFILGCAQFASWVLQARNSRKDHRK